MKKIVLYLMILLSISCVTGCTPLVHHSDPFYDINDNDFPRNHLPLIKPIEATRKNSSSPWSVSLMPYSPKVYIPNSDVVYPYSHVEELKKFAVRDGVIMAYSSYVNKQADAYIQDNYYHWFVIVPEKKITKGFHTEDEFNQYIQTVDIQNPDWQTPDEAYKKFAETGCLDWIPNCK